MARRRNPPGWTTASGLGAAHQAARRDLLTRLQPGLDRCPYTRWCGRAPMWGTPLAALHAGHPRWHGELDVCDFPGRIFGGPQVKVLGHARCNRAAGAALGNHLRAAGVRRRPPVRRAPAGARKFRW